MSISNAPRHKVAVSASIVNADMLVLSDEFDRLRDAGVTSLHLDLEDGHFAPVMNLGTRVIAAATRWGKLPVDVHLMVENPEEAIALLSGLPLRTVACHAESTRYPRRVLRIIREHGWNAGLAFNPATPMNSLEPLSAYLDNILILTTEPETGNAPFLDACLPQVTDAVAVAKRLGVSVTVDGGINPSNIELIASTGVDTVVVGRALFDSHDLRQTILHISEGGSHE